MASKAHKALTADFLFDTTTGELLVKLVTLALAAENAVEITPSDVTVLTACALYVGGAGSVVATIGGVDVTFAAVPAGTLLPVKATKVKAASTATSIVGLW